MGNQTGKLYKVLANNEIISAELEYSRRFGCGQIVRLELDEVLGSITRDGEKRTVKFCELWRPGCFELVSSGELEETKPAAVFDIADENETDEGDQP